MIVFDKVQHFYQEKTLAAFLMVIGLVDVEVGQIQCPSWDVFSSFTLLNLAEISAFLINLTLNRFQIIMITWGTGTCLLAPSLLVQTYLFASFERAKQLSCIRNLSVSEVIPLYSLYR